MAKQKNIFVCRNCGANAPKWIGKCPACGEWNTYEEEVLENKTDTKRLHASGNETKAKPLLLSEVKSEGEKRIRMPGTEFNRVLGGGMVPGSLVLIGGEPGIGKSTLMLQTALRLVKTRTLYVSGEESLNQIKLRATRIENGNNDNCYFLSETSLENIFVHIKSLQPQLVIIDSIQTLYTDKAESSPGTITQIRECTAYLLRYAKESNTPVVLIGHITKEGSIAGPKLLEHIVDTVLQFEGDRYHVYRLLRAIKNRFGSTSELGIYEMQNIGLREVVNPSEMLLSQSEETVSGVAVAANMEGARPLLIEIQALVATAAYGTPQRSATGFDMRRLSMLLAVLEKRAGFRLSSKDVFLNVAGGLKIDDPASDLSVICSILSSDQDLAIKKGACFAGEVGLSGEIRPVTRIEQRISEAQKLGFSKIFISKYNRKGTDFSKFTIQIEFVAKVEEVFEKLFR